MILLGQTELGTFYVFKEMFQLHPACYIMLSKDLWYSQDSVWKKKQMKTGKVFVFNAALHIVAS